MAVKLGNITQALKKDLFQVGQFVQLYLQLDCIVQAIERTVWQANSDIEHYSYSETCSHWDTFHHQSLPQGV